MATNFTRKVGYGLSEPLPIIGLEPIVTKRDPTTADKAPIGAEWINTVGNTAFFLTSIEDNISTWIPVTNVGTSPEFVADSGTAIPVAGILRVTGSGITSTSGSGNTLTINSPVTNYVTSAGTATPSSNTINFIGGTGVATTGSGSTVTISLSGGAPVDSVTGGNNITITGTATNPIVNVSGTTNHSVQVGNSTGSLTSLAVGTNGQVLLGATGANPSFITPTAGTGLSITSNATTLQYALSSPVISTIDTDFGTGATGSTIFLKTNNAMPNSAGTPAFSSTGATITLEFEDSSGNLTIGSNARNASPGGNSNVAYGPGCMGGASFTGSSNTAVGNDAFQNISTSSNSCAFGFDSGVDQSTGTGNCYFGYQSGGDTGPITGSYNVEVGYRAGFSYTSSESSNISINASTSTVVAENNVLRIGNGTGTGNQQLEKAFVSGIQGITVTGAAVLISSSDQLGIAVSSKRFKNDVQTMNAESEAIYKLRPVTFVINRDSAPGLADATTDRQCGLIAEEVAQVLPQYVYRDSNGDPLSVHYGDLTALLIKEVQRLSARIEALEVLAKPDEALGRRQEAR